MSHSVVLFLLVLAPALAMVLALLGLETVERNILGWLDFAIGVGYPSGAIIHFWNRRRPFRQHRDGRRPVVEGWDNGSFWLILPGVLVTLFAPALEYLYLSATLHRAGWMQTVGLALIVPGAALIFWARTTLKGWHSRHVQVTARHPFVRNGPYRLIRHPGYTGYLLMTLGFCLGYSSVIGLAAIPILLLPGFAYRISLEEKLLAVSFGDEYRAYARKTKRLLPGIW
jgi:protein-S-isoprenylcysteine O-methyltransferase Ste14